MALKRNLWQTVLHGEFSGHLEYSWRLYTTKVDLKKLRPMILERIEKRANEYPVRAMVPVAMEVLKARNVLIQGVSTLIKSFPIMACK